MPTFITGENNTLVTGENGNVIAGDVATSNDDIQEVDFSINLLAALLWQYNEAPNLQSLLNSKQAWYTENQQQFWENWITNVFDLRTANAFGLSVWAIILGFPSFISSGATPTDFLSWGFDAGSGQFDQSTFGSSTGETNNLPLATKRIALQLRYFQLCSSGTVPEINRFMNYIFQDYGKVVLIDNLNMTQEYVFLFPLTWDLLYLFNNFDILPRPAGVLSTFRSSAEIVWGFDAGSGQFDESNFGQ